MPFHRTLERYLVRRFLVWVAIVLAVLAAISFLADLVELLRRSGSRQHATFDIVLQMAALKVSTMLELLLPFAVLFGGLFAFDRLARRNELVAAQGAGVSVWRLVAPALVAALAIGAAKVALYGPLAAAAADRFQRLESVYFGNAGPVSALANRSLWLREIVDGDLTILFAAEIGARRVLHDVVLYRFDGLERLRERLDARSAELHDGYWLLEDIWTPGADGTPARAALMTAPTTLDWDRIEDGFAAPETLSVWRLMDYAAVLEAAGFPARKHRLRFHAELASVAMTGAMLLIGAAVSIRSRRRGGAAVMLAAGVGAGFLLFILSDIVFALGLSGRAPAMLAAWTPAAAALLLGCAALLHLEDG